MRKALAQAIGSHDDIDSDLADYNRIRQPIGERIMLHGRKLEIHLGVNLQTDEERVTWRRLQDHWAKWTRSRCRIFLRLNRIMNT